MANWAVAMVVATTPRETPHHARPAPVGVVPPLTRELVLVIHFISPIVISPGGLKTFLHSFNVEIRRILPFFDLSVLGTDPSSLYTKDVWKNRNVPLFIFSDA